MQIDLLNGYEGRSRSTDTRRFVNMYPELNSQSSKGIASLVSTPGMSLFASVAGVIRGVHVIGSKAYIVAAGTLWEINSLGTTTALGTIGTTSGHVSMADNGQQICIVDGQSGYIFDIGAATLTQITAAGFPNGALFVDFLDGFFVCEKPDTQQF
ncbi:MAG: hypothetical protein D6751_09765, partial [Deltaproteobacteria bacterium]